MRRKSFLPGAVLTLLTLVCLLIPSRVTWTVRERALGFLRPVLRLLGGGTAQAAHENGELPKDVQARIAQLQTRLETDQRIFNSLRGPGAADRPASLPDPNLGPMGKFLARPIWNGRALYTVDIGADHGVEIGDGVIAQGGGTGVVVALSDSTATFGPLTYPDVAIQAMVARSRATGLLIGTGRGLELRYLQMASTLPAGSLEKETPPPGERAWASYGPQPGSPAAAAAGADNPLPGDLIVATGRDGLFPEGTPLGWVETVATETNNSGGLLRITVKPWCDPNTADAVRVVPRRTETIPLPDDPRVLRKRWEALQAAESPPPTGTGAPHGGARP